MTVVATVSGVLVPDNALTRAASSTSKSSAGARRPRYNATGYSFQIARNYSSRAQADAFQALLDRLQALNLIAWVRGAATIEVTVASDASRVIVNGP